MGQETSILVFALSDSKGSNASLFKDKECCQIPTYTCQVDFEKCHLKRGGQDFCFVFFEMHLDI